MFGLGLGEWLLIIAVVLVLFGAGPFIKAFKSLKNSANALSDGVRDGLSEKDGEKK
ncbi:MAG: twin-arginine translocase TatA/TatE family subunit [bacterium]|nr:twin-arginine translocase TatA/TatE family subunit [bacterium]